MAVGKEAGNGTGAGKRRIWEFQSSTTCRVLGLSFDEKELKKIFKELKLSHDNLYPTAFKMHQHLAQVCGTQNQHAKRIEKLLDRQFATYKNKPGIAEPQKSVALLSAIMGQRQEEIRLKTSLSLLLSGSLHVM